MTKPVKLVRIKKKPVPSKLKVFVSWSGELSRDFAKHLDDLLKIVFSNKIKTFYSPDDIKKGEKWFEKISVELTTADVCIIVLTKDNYKSQWLNFEAGAIAHNKSKDKLICPILVDIKQLDKSNPLHAFQVTKYDKVDIHELFKSIRDKFKKTLNVNPAHFEDVFSNKFELLRENFDRFSSLTNSENFIDISDQKIYPSTINKIERNKVFIGAPMASTTEYEVIRGYMVQLKKLIVEQCGLSNVYYPGDNIRTSKDFHGKGSAIAIDFKELKECEYCIFIYPEKVASSILLEIGYAIATIKKIIIFTKEKETLPFMLQEAEKKIPNLVTYFFHDYTEILQICETEKAGLFEYGT